MNEIALVKTGVGCALLIVGAVLELIGAKTSKAGSEAGGETGCIGGLVMVAGLAALFWGLKEL